MNSDQFQGIVERIVYGLAVWATTQLVAKGYIDGDTASWLAAGAVTFAGGLYAFIRNRPVSVLNRAAAAVPESSRLVIETPINAPPAERQIARDLGDKTVDKVSAQTASR